MYKKLLLKILTKTSRSTFKAITESHMQILVLW